jgi:hypothetical protein
LCFKHVDNLGAYSIPSETGLLIPSGYINHGLSRAPFATRARTSVPSPRRSRVPFVGC